MSQEVAPTDSIQLHPKFNRTIRREINPGTNRPEGLLSSVLSHHLELRLPSTRRDLLSGRNCETAYVYKVNPKTGDGVVHPQIWGTEGEAYGVPTRSLVDPRCILHFFGRKRNDRWVLVTFNNPTKTPPERLTAEQLSDVQTTHSIARRPIQKPTRE